MAANVTLLAGPARSGKTARLLDRYRQFLKSNPPGTALWIAPTYRSVDALRHALLNDQLPACLSPGFTTFDHFAEAVLAASDRAVRPLAASMKRTLVRNLIEEAHAAGQLKHFAPIAGTSGLVDLVCDLISEWKRLEIWPEHFAKACQQRGMTDKDRELLWLYETYQARLLANQYYDAQGRFWTARELLRLGQQRPFENLQCIVVDGFTDFTRTQHEILEILAERTRRILISLPLEQNTEREDLFAKSQDTVHKLTRRHPDLETVWVDRATNGFPALEHLETQLFAGPRHMEPAPTTQGLEILAAAGTRGEVEQIARRVKQLLTGISPDAQASDDVTADDIVVVYRSLGSVGPLVEEIFDRYGIPTALDWRPPLAGSPVTTFVLQLLQLVQEDWPFRRLLQLMRHNFFQPLWPCWNGGLAADSVDQVVRHLQLPSGRDVLLREARQLQQALAAREAAQFEKQNGQSADGDEENDEETYHFPLSSATVEEACQLLEQLAAVLNLLPVQGTALQWKKALEQVAAEFNLLAAIDASPTRKVRQRDQSAWQSLLTALEREDQLLAELQLPVPQRDAGGMVHLVTDISQNESLPRETNECGRVRVLSAANMRFLQARFLFFAGLTETSFPSPSRTTGLYSESETARLREAGLPLTLRAEHSQEEMLLFYEVINRATERLYFSYPALDSKAQVLLPSPFLAEVEQAAGVGSIQRTSEFELTSVPTSPRPLSYRDLRVKAVHEVVDEGSEDLFVQLAQGSIRPLVPRLVSGLHVIYERSRREGFGPHEGMLLSPAARQELQKRFGPQRTWSASQLEDYAKCPYQFFAQRVLKIEPLEELVLETDFMRRGGYLHAALAKLHAQLNESGPGPASLVDVGEAEFTQHVDQVLTAVVRGRGEPGRLQVALREIDRRTLANWLANYREQHKKYESDHRDGWQKPLLPEFFEVPFGGKPDRGAELGTSQALELGDGAGRVKLAGRIDRIDLGEIAGQKCFAIVDYKSSGYGPSKHQDGRWLQLDLYLLAAEELLFAGENRVPWESGYWYIRGKGHAAWQQVYETQNGKLQPMFDRASQRAHLVQRVLELAAGIRAGEFPVFSLDERCTSYCPYSTVCRINQVRSLEKTWPPPLTPSG